MSTRLALVRTYSGCAQSRAEKSKSEHLGANARHPLPLRSTTSVPGRAGRSNAYYLSGEPSYDPPRPATCVPPTDSDSRLQRHRHRYSCAGHRSQHRHLQRGECCSPPPRRSRPSGARCDPDTCYKQLGMDFPGVSVPDYADAAALSRSWSRRRRWSGPSASTRSTTARVEHVTGAQVGSQWFQVFGARPILGRTFTAEEDQPNAGPVAVISYGLVAARLRWKPRRRRPDPDARSEAVPGDRRDAQRFRLAAPQPGLDTDRARPKDFAADQRYNENYQTFIRLRPGATIAQVNAGMNGKVREQIRVKGQELFRKQRRLVLLRLAADAIRRRPTAQASLRSLRSGRTRSAHRFRQRCRTLSRPHRGSHPRIRHPHRAGRKRIRHRRPAAHRNHAARRCCDPDRHCRRTHLSAASCSG